MAVENLDIFNEMSPHLTSFVYTYTPADGFSRVAERNEYT